MKIDRVLRRTKITLTASEADSLAAVLHEHVIMGEMFAGHSGPIRRAYPYLTELAAALCEQKDLV
jgi:hypothetical protein